MKKIALFLIGIVLILGSLLFFLYGTAQLASASNTKSGFKIGL